MHPIANAEIIAVGSELLTASRLDTNSLAITERLRALGIALRAKTVVGRKSSSISQRSSSCAGTPMASPKRRNNARWPSTFRGDPSK